MVHSQGRIDRFLYYPLIITMYIRYMCTLYNLHELIDKREVFLDQHGGEGRLSEKFADVMQHVSGDDVRYCLVLYYYFLLHILYLLLLFSYCTLRTPINCIHLYAGTCILISIRFVGMSILSGFPYYMIKSRIFSLKIGMFISVSQPSP